MFAVHRQETASALPDRLSDEGASGNEGFLVCQRDLDSVVRSRQCRSQTDHPGDGGKHRIAAFRGRADKPVFTGEYFDSQTFSVFLLKLARFFRIHDTDRIRTVFLCLLREKLCISRTAQTDDIEFIRKLIDDLQGLSSDRTGRTENREPFSSGSLFRFRALILLLCIHTVIIAL